MKGTKNLDAAKKHLAAEVTQAEADLTAREARVEMAEEKVGIQVEKAGIELELVLAVIDVESSFDRFASSSAGARGLMQIMPWWRDELGRPDDNLFIIRTNLRYGCTILRYYYDLEHGNLTKALARYNGSRGQRWYPDRVMTRLSTKWYQQ